ncbi:MAG: hypothetical protein J7M12_03425 [Candidatus Hydrogenedentes bacterium]|nr:hypothetical protein [Candidatus Hydrogenedentota bacterium]
MLQPKARCYRCGAPLDETVLRRFKGICDSCNAWTHCCRNCFLFDETRHNNCKSSSTEWVGDPEMFNYCAEFDIVRSTEENGGELADSDVGREAWNRLFKDE